MPQYDILIAGAGIGGLTAASCLMKAGHRVTIFEQAPELGSLIDPKALKGNLLVADFAELQPLLEQALAREPENVEDAERAVAAGFGFATARCSGGNEVSNQLRHSAGTESGASR